MVCSLPETSQSHPTVTPPANGSPSWTELSTRAATETGERLLDWVNVVAEQWLSSIVRYLVDAPDLTAAELLQHQGAEATAEQLEAHVSGWEHTVRRMNTRINTMLAAGQVLWPTEWPNAKDLIAIELPHATDEFVAATVYEAQHAQLSGTGLTAQELDDSQPSSVERMPELVSGQAMTLRREIVQSRLTEARRIERELTTRLAVAEAELAATDKSRVASKSTIWTMAIFSLAGIGWPLGTLAYGLDRMPHLLRWINLAVICIGIPLVLWLLLHKSPADPTGKKAGDTAEKPAAAATPPQPPGHDADERTSARSRDPA